MGPNTTPPVGPRRDDIGAPGAGSPGVAIPRELQSLLDQTEVAVGAAEREFSAALSGLVATATADVDAAERDLGVTVSGVIGAIDTDLYAAEQETDRVLSKEYANLLSDVLYQENALTTVGVHIPIMTDEIAAVMARDDPDDLLHMLMGKPPPLDRDAPVGGGFLTPVTAPPVIVSTEDGSSPPPPPGAPPGRVTPPPVIIPADDPPTAPPGPSPAPVPPAPPPAPGDCDCPPVVTTCAPSTDCHVEHVIVCGPGTGTSPAPSPPPPTEPPIVCPVGFHAQQYDTGLPPPDDVKWHCVPDPPVPPLPSPPVPPLPSPPVPPGPGEPPDGSKGGVPPHPGWEPVRPDSVAPFGWCRPAVCTTITDKLRAIEFDPALTPDTPPSETPAERSLMGDVWAGITYPFRSMYVLGSWIGSGFDSEYAEEANRESARQFGLEGLGAEALRTVLSGPFRENIQHLPAVMRLGSQLSLAAKAEEWTHFPMTYLVQSSQYLFQFANPQYIPSQPELDAIFLMGLITQQDWECLTKANGNLPECFIKVLQAKQTKAGVSDVVRLWQRGEIDLGQYYVRMRELGVVEERYANEFMALGQFIPPYTDIISFMVRDTFDKKVVEKYQYDKDFEVKFTAKAAEWAKDQGIAKDVFQQIWRAHWKIPSNTQLYEILHRFREDRKDVREWDRLFHDPNTGEDLPEAPPRPPTVTEKDVIDALEINDNAPYWIKFLIGINARPITRTDAIDAYHAGAFTEEELFESLRDNMYSPTNAKQVVDIQKVKRGRRMANLSGVWTFRKIIKAFQDGSIDRVKADALLAPLLTDGGQRVALLQGAIDEVEARTRRQWIKRARRAFFVGEWTKVQTTEELEARKVYPAVALQLVEEWDAERTGRFREPTVRLLVQWFVTGSISQDDLFTRCNNLGYSVRDCNRIVSLALDTSVQRQRKDFSYVRGEYEHAVKNLSQAAKEETTYLTGRKAELERAAKKVRDELTRIEKELSDRLP